MLSFDRYLYLLFGLFTQIGGNDQLGNIVAGYELISKVSKQPVFGEYRLRTFFTALTKLSPQTQQRSSLHIYIYISETVLATCKSVCFYL